jgi:hypothetical protein
MEKQGRVNDLLYRIEPNGVAAWLHQENAEDTSTGSKTRAQAHERGVLR